MFNRCFYICFALFYNVFGGFCGHAYGLIWDILVSFYNAFGFQVFVRCSLVLTPVGMWLRVPPRCAPRTYYSRFYTELFFVLVVYMLPNVCIEEV